MVNPGLINLDFADVRTVMDEMGKAMMGTGEASGDNRAIEAAKAAISNPLLEDIAISGARGVLINITGGDDLTLHEVDEAASLIRAEVDEEANIIIGSTFDKSLSGGMRVSVVATGITEGVAMREPASTTQPVMGEPVQAQEVIQEPVSEPVLEPLPQPIPVAAQVTMPEPVEQTISDPVYNSSEAAAMNAPLDTKLEAPAPKFGFNIFRPKRRPVGAPPAMVKPVEQRIEPVVEARGTIPVTTPDLFLSSVDDELEIPAFLRRQAN
jgi:cell division protein FtsZ